MNEWIAGAYDQLVDHFAGPDFNQEYGIGQHRLALRFCACRNHALEVGCGSSSRIRSLLEGTGFASVTGIDISPRMIGEAKRRDPAAKLIFGDFCTVELDETYDFISAWDSIWHIDLSLHEMVVQKIARLLAPGGVVILTTGGVERPDERTNPMLGVPLYHSAPGVGNLLGMLGASGLFVKHLEYDQHPLDHVFLVAMKPRTSNEL